jgi:hypothetical protein
MLKARQAEGREGEMLSSVHNANLKTDVEYKIKMSICQTIFDSSFLF